MSKNQLKKSMQSNQKINRMQLDKLANNLGFKQIKVGHTKEQEELANFTANILRTSIDQKVFTKTKEERRLFKEVSKKKNLTIPFSNERAALILT